MDCKDSQTMIVDYFLDDLDEILKDNLLSHLKECSECRESYVKYKELLSISRVKDPDNLPRYEIIDRLQQIARMNSNKDESRFKRFFQLPVLVPVISATMVVMIFFNIQPSKEVKVASDKPAELIQENSVVLAEAVAPVDYSSQMSNMKKSKQNKEKDEVKKTDTSFDSSLVVRSDFSPNLKKEVLISKINDDLSFISKAKPQFIQNVDSEYFAKSQEKPSPAKNEDNENIVEPDEVLTSDSLAFRSDFTLKEDIAGKGVSLSFNEGSLESFEVASADNARSQMLSTRLNEFDQDFTDNKREKSDENLSDTSEFCDKKINENLRLLEDSDISIEEKKSAHITLAECYELKGNWQEALNNYQSLKSFENSPNNNYQEKINFIFENHIQK